MTEGILYVPVLKGKEGELAALETLHLSIRSRIMPLLELPPIPFDHVKKQKTKTDAEHLDGIVSRLGKFSARQQLYLHIGWQGSSDQIEEAGENVHIFLSRLRLTNIEAIPVITFQSSQSYLQATMQHNEATNLGFCIRMRMRDFNEEIDQEQELSRIQQALGLRDASTIDLVIDLGDLGTSPEYGLHTARSIFSILPRADKFQWRRLILVAASFPKDLRDIDAASTILLERKEWNLWLALQRKPGALPRRNLIFGDYAISNPLAKELDPIKMVMSANIRYTTDRDWLILKGRSVRKYKFTQYFQLCESLVERKEFCGGDFSWGDWFIEQCALAMQGPGNATTWRKVGVNHHLTFVAAELAKLVHGI